MHHTPAELVATLDRHGQRHLLTAWDSLSPEAKSQFVAQLQTVPFAELNRLFERRNDPPAVLPPRERIAPLPVESWESISAETKRIGEEAIRAGKVAVLVVAGGLGSRLGFEHPKGMYPIGPVSNAPLFQFHTEKVRLLRKLYGGAVPFLVMTSPQTHDETVAFFEQKNRFGLDDVHFFQQGTMPALDASTGQLLLEAPGQLFLGPNGHGGTLTALADTGLLAQLKSRGIEQIFYFQVDNPLVRIGDPVFIGRHIEMKSEVSSKVVFKTAPGERVGVLAQVDRRCSIIEYSDLPKAIAEERTTDGTLAFRAGSPAIHCFSLAFLERVTQGASRLAFHTARKKVPYYDPHTKTQVQSKTENALKFELFVFDALPLAERWLAVSVKREEEFAPLKNASGTDSAEDVKRAILREAKRQRSEIGLELV